MAQASALLTWLMANGLPLLGAVSSLLAGLYAVALIIPGEQPDKVIKSLLDFTQKWSNK